MLSAIFFLTSVIILPILLGWLLISLFFPKIVDSYFERAGISYGIGLGAITIIEVIFLYFRIKIAPPTFFPTLILITTTVFLIAKRNICERAPNKKENLNLISKVMLGLIIVQGAWVFIKAFNLPIISDDAVVIWGLKAKNIYFSNSAGDSFGAIVDKMRFTLSGNYPLLVPLLENYVNISPVGWNDLAPKIVSPIYYISLLSAFFGLLKKITDKNHALVFTFFLGTLPFLADSAADAIADLPFAYYYCISSILVLIWMQTKRNSYLYLSAIFSGFSIWTKNEGYPSLLISLTVILIFTIFNVKFYRKDLVKGATGFFIITLIVASLVIHYQHLTGVKEGIINSQTLSFARITQNYTRMPIILYQLQRQLLGTPNKWNLLGHLFVFVILLHTRKVFRPPYFYFLLAIFLNFSLYISVYLLSPHEINYHLGTSQNRVLLHFTPLIVFFSAIVLYQKQET